MSETRSLFESYQNNLNESNGRKLSFEEYVDLYDPHCNLTDEELKQMYELDKDELYTDEDIERIKKEIKDFSDIEESALNEGNRVYKKGDIVYWIGAGNEISAEGQIIDFPDKERMTIKWDDGEVNTYSINHPDIEHADDYTELEPEDESALNEDEQPTSIDDIIYRISEYIDNAGFSTEEILKEFSKFGVSDSIFISILKTYEEYLNEEE